MSLIPTVTIEQAALNALGRWLGAGLAGYEVSYTWPDPERALTKAISILRAGPRQDDDVDPFVVDSETIDLAVTAYASPADPADLPTSIAVVTFLVASYEAHRLDITVHQAADTANAVTAPAATDLPSAIARAENLRAVLNAHAPDLVAHPTEDIRNGVAVPPAVDLPSLLVLLAALLRALGRHYVARIDVWSLRGCRLPVQLDVWTVYEAVRDQTLALLEPLLNADPYDSAGLGYFPGEPGRNGVVVQLGDGWRGVVDFDFNEPQLLQTDRSQQVSEFRASYHGVCELMLLVKAQSSRLALLTLNNQLDATTRTTALSATGTTNTEG